MTPAASNERCGRCGKLYSEKAHRCMICGHDTHIHEFGGWSIGCPCEKPHGSSAGFEYSAPDAFVPSSPPSEAKR